MRMAGLVMLAALASACQAGMTDKPAAAALNVELGAAYLSQGRLDLAHDKLRRATRQDARSAEAHRVLGMLYEQLEDTGRAEEHYRRAVRLAPSDVEALNSLGVFRCRRPGEAAKGLKLLRRAAEEASGDRRADVYANCGLCVLSQDRNSAAEWFRRALELDPQHVQARYLLEQLERHN